MKYAWKTFWQALASLFSAIGYLAEAGEEYGKNIRDDARFTSDKDALKREAKIKAWKAKIQQADA